MHLFNIGHKIKPVPKSLGPLALWYLNGDYAAQVEAKKLANQVTPSSFAPFGITSKHSGQFFKGCFDHIYEMVPAAADAIEWPLAELGLVSSKFPPSAVIFIASVALDSTLAQRIRNSLEHIFVGTKLILYSLNGQSPLPADLSAAFDKQISSTSEVEALLHSLPSTTSVNIQLVEQYVNQKVSSAPPTQAPQTKQWKITITSDFENELPQSHSFSVTLPPSTTMTLVEGAVRKALNDEATKLVPN